MCSGCRVRTLQTHSMRTRPAARTRTAADRCDRDLWPKRISQLYYDSGFQVQEASAEWDDSRSARTGGIHSLQWKVRRAFLLFTLILLCSAAFLGFGYFCLWKHVNCIWILWQKKTKSESENAGQRLTMAMIDKDRPPRILVDSGFLPKFTVKFHQLFKCYLENRNAAVLFYHKLFT